MKKEPTGTELAVCEDIASRQEMGKKKYGVEVAKNPLTHKQWLQHAYEESLDHAIYLKQSMLTHSDAQSDVEEFMRKAEQDIPPRPVMPPDDVAMLRVKLIAEELDELASALGVDLSIINGAVGVSKNDRPPGALKDVYDGVLDIMVVAIGTASACGMTIAPGWIEVHRSNMSKFIDGHRRADGKWIKGPSYSPANLQPILDAQAGQSSLL